MNFDFDTFALTKVMGKAFDVAFEFITRLFRRTLWFSNRTHEEEITSSADNSLMISQVIDLCKRQLSVLERFAASAEANEFIPTCRAAIEDLEEQRVRVYVIGHQKAGKSTLINSLSGVERSRVYTNKCTACLVHIRYGRRKDVKVTWPDGTTQEMPYKAFSSRMLAWSQTRDRPYKAEVWTPHLILGSVRNELLDTPGSGSHDDDLGTLSEERLVQEAIQAAAAAILVFRLGHTGYDAHRRLLEGLARSGVAVFVVCNIDADYREKFEHEEDRLELETCVEEAEREISRMLQSATMGKRAFKHSFYRINLRKAGSSATFKENVSGSKSLQELIDELADYLNHRDRLILEQSIKTLQHTVLSVGGRTSQVIERIEQRCLALEEEVTKRKADFSRMMEAIEKREGAVGIAGGATAGGIIGGEAGLWVDTVMLGTTFGLFTAIGGILGAITGAITGSSGLEKSAKEVEEAWRDFCKPLGGSTTHTLRAQEDLEKLWRAALKEGTLDRTKLDRLIGTMGKFIDGVLPSDPEYIQYRNCRSLKAELDPISAKTAELRKQILS